MNHWLFLTVATFITCRALMLVASHGLFITMSVRAGNCRRALGRGAHSVGAAPGARLTIRHGAWFAALAPETEPANTRAHAIMGVACNFHGFVCGMRAFVPSILSLGVHKEPGGLLTTITLLGAMRPG